MIYIKKDSSLIQAVIEDFGEDIYDATELRVFVYKEITDYNDRVNNANAIALNKLKMNKKEAVLYLKYSSIEYYADYHDIELFQGTIGEAIEAGYDMSGEFLETKKNVKLMNHDWDLNLHVIIIKEETMVEIEGKILYVSNNIKLKHNKLAITTKDEYNYIIYE